MRRQKALPSDDTVFHHLCRSAFDFLTRSAKEIETEPKYALIHFCSGLELILKARLIKEHWSLAVLSRPDLKKFQTGDFTSVTASEAMERIVKVIGDTLPKDTQATFERIVQHRNRVVHFVHDLERAAQESLKKTVAGELCLGWYFLKERLEAWSTHFKEFKSEITATSGAMKRLRTFLQIVYDQNKKHLEHEKENGGEVTECPSCNFEAGLVTPLTGKLYSLRCLVCGCDVPQIRFCCPDEDCGIVHTVSGWHNFQNIQCDCGELISQDDLRNALDTDTSNPSEGLYTPINCAECTGHDTVVEHERYYICVECCSYSIAAPQCDWCSERQIGGGSLEYSAASGCDFCEGRAGWDAGD